jgi:multidrug efflux pump subunit AcrA (membrane-fusion protein)
MKPLLMKSLKRLSIITAGFILSVMYSCGEQNSTTTDEKTVTDPQSPVTVTTVANSDLIDSVELNATSVFLQKNYVKSNANGYIQSVSVQPGHFIGKGQLMFTVKTKEAQSIGNTINVLDTTFKFSGVNRIKASGSGYVTQLTHQVGDYVQDGEQLAVISDRESFAFLLQVPYELRRLISNNQNLILTMPDGERLNGHLSSVMPAVDTLSQTQGVVIKVNSSHPIPENLVAKARLIKTAKSSALSLPKSAILANDTQTDFWVMKLLNDTTAVKVPVKKGIESGDRVEVLFPKFNSHDRIIVTGNYGLTDTAKVKIVKP